MNWWRPSLCLVWSLYGSLKSIHVHLSTEHHLWASTLSSISDAYFSSMVFMARDFNAVNMFTAASVSSSLAVAQKNGGLKSMGLVLPRTQLKVLKYKQLLTFENPSGLLEVCHQQREARCRTADRIQRGEWLDGRMVSTCSQSYHQTPLNSLSQTFVSFHNFPFVRTVERPVIWMTVLILHVFVSYSNCHLSCRVVMRHVHLV